MVEFIIKKQLFIIFYNKINTFGNCKQKSHFKKVPLLIFQFPSPPTLNN